MYRIVVVGGGFAGLWAALGAARKFAQLDVTADQATVTLINRDRWHAIRVRNYEADLSEVRVPLHELLDPVGIQLVVGEVSGVDADGRTVTVTGDDRVAQVSYDRLVLAAGSQLQRPAIPGLGDHTFDIDTFDAAKRFDNHLRALTSVGETIAIIGGGLTGIELACEIPDRLTAAGVVGGRAILLDRHSQIGSNMGDEAVAVILEALDELGVEIRAGVTIDRIDECGVILVGGERIVANTVVWTAGLGASPLGSLISAERDGAGRLVVDSYLRVVGVSGVLAAGDIAAAPLGDGRFSVMSCQHARPMGRFAGHNAVCDLLAPDELLPLEIDSYVTCLDLGPWGAVFTEGWDRAVAAKGIKAKNVKRRINCERIYPPRTGDIGDIFNAAAPAVQDLPSSERPATPD